TSMDQNNTNQGNEDTRAAEAHTQNAHDNLEALRDQNRRTEATAGDSANHPVGQQNSGGGIGAGNGMNATGSGSGSGNGMNATGGGTGGNTGTASEDNTQAAANVSNAQDNRDALAEQARRTEETTPDSVRDPIRQPDNQR
ncbi:MAG TPA: hypothetical protein VK358_07670, partial [Longimicrobium sp.]|nr:hypothetical protein [Longimicrobium sp.]